MKNATLNRFGRTAVGVAMALAILLPVSRRVLADKIPEGWEASNMKPIGYSDLEGHGAFKMTIRHVNDHWYLYMGHLWLHGWSIVDVTDPANPKLVKFIKGPENTWTIQMEMHDNLMITALQSESAEWGGSSDPKAPFDEGVMLWDISDPVNPKELSHWKTGAQGTHRNGYPGGKYAYLSASMPGYKGNILLILDVSDPQNPKEAGRWWMPGQKEGEPPLTQPTGFHGPPTIEGSTAYLAYGPSVVVLDIEDVSKPKLVGQLNYSPPFKGGPTSGHDVLKIPGKPLLFVHSEGSGGDTSSMAPTCTGPLDITAMIDIQNPAKPRLMSLFPLPAPPKDAPYSNFCDKGGRFGPHNTNLEYHLPDVEKQANLVYLTYFNAGLRIFDIEDPRMPKEAGWFIPPQPTKRIGPIPAKLVSQTEDVLVDTRGNIYITDKQWGLFVLRYTGKGEPPPTAK